MNRPYESSFSRSLGQISGSLFFLFLPSNLAALLVLAASALLLRSCLFASLLNFSATNRRTSTPTRCYTALVFLRLGPPYRFPSHLSAQSAEGLITQLKLRGSLAWPL